jgi:hypothetical protein
MIFLIPKRTAQLTTRNFSFFLLLYKLHSETLGRFGNHEKSLASDDFNISTNHTLLSLYTGSPRLAATSFKITHVG